jgi:flagellar protein FliO/FliZ
MKNKLLVFFLLTLVSNITFAEVSTSAISKNLEPSSYLWQIIMSLFFILLLIFVSAWLLKRFGKINGLASSNMQILANMSVGQRERVILLEVGTEQLLIGVTASEISLLHEMKEPIDFSINKEQLGFENKITQTFSMKLQQAMATKKNKEVKSD